MADLGDQEASQADRGGPRPVHGLASYPGYTSAQDLTEAADNALLEAKRLGRNRVEKAPARNPGT